MGILVIMGKVLAAQQGKAGGCGWVSCLGIWVGCWASQTQLRLRRGCGKAVGEDSLSGGQGSHRKYRHKGNAEAQD